MGKGRDPGSIGNMIVTFSILLLFWYILSGYLEPFYIIAGIICCVIVTLISGDLLLRSDAQFQESAVSFIRFVLYIPKLFVAILVANIDVAYRILHPKMPIDPGMITLQTDFYNDVLRTAFANAMTLTPGTVTVDVRYGRYVVHALVLESSERELHQEKDIQNNLARIFGEN
ncbi:MULTISPECIES: Na+/H+ antiporter subunit E [Methanocalculus]|uniref:Na+/H+ antiporter subunit E n=1 Tax=Methanocalculus TaxID=71151 RepID=UPI0020A1F783|nr:MULTISPECIES: Na+/H+ antiporter subunit E [unclassified Methanocalculus]MCP1662685.1 multicomponent Na+:H+ antiporter subunit E [Methanocalculus sp. AMF5]